MLFFFLGLCNWCGHCKILLPNKKFCFTCSTNGQECGSCHRPLGEKFFTDNSTICDTCVRKQKKASGKFSSLRSVSDSFSSHTLTPVDCAEASDIINFLYNRQSEIRDHIIQKVLDYGAVKFYMDCIVEVEKKITSPCGEIKSHIDQPVFKTEPEIALRVNQIDLTSSNNRILHLLEKYSKEGSGWVFKNVSHLILHIFPYTPIEGSTFIPT